MALITCPECGAQISDKATTCPKCGAPVEKKIVCEECGTEVSPGVSTCPNCGAPIQQPFQSQRNPSQGYSQPQYAVQVPSSPKSK